MKAALLWLCLAVLASGSKALKCYNFDPNKPPLVNCDKAKGCSTVGKGGCGSGDKNDKKNSCFERTCNAKVCDGKTRMGEKSKLYCPGSEATKCQDIDPKECRIKCSKNGLESYCPASKGNCVETEKLGCGDGSDPFLDHYGCTHIYKYPEICYGSPAFCWIDGHCATENDCKENEKLCCTGDDCTKTCKDEKCLKRIPGADCEKDGQSCKLQCFDFTLNPPFIYCDKAKGCSTVGKGGCGSDEKNNSCFESICNTKICKRKMETLKGKWPDLYCPGSEASKCEDFFPEDFFPKDCRIKCSKNGVDSFCPASKGNCVETEKRGCGDGSDLFLDKTSCYDFTRYPPFVNCDRAKGCANGQKGGCNMISNKKDFCLGSRCNGKVCMLATNHGNKHEVICPGSNVTKCEDFICTDCWIKCSKNGTKSYCYFDPNTASTMHGDLSAQPILTLFNICLYSLYHLHHLFY